MRVVRAIGNRPGLRGAAARRVGAVAGTAFLLGLAACAPSLQHEHADLETLTQAQMAPNHFHSAYEAVQALRGNWFNVRPHSLLGSPEDVAVYLDNVRLGGLSELQNIPLTSVLYIRHYDSTEATTLWGIGHAQGVIYVSTHPLGSAAGPPGS